MSGVNVEVQPAVLDWVLEQTQFMDVSGAVLDRLQQWRAGEKKPTFAQVKEISRKTHIPFGCFLLREPPVENCDIVDYRTVDSEVIQRPSRELIDIVNRMVRVQDWMADYCRDEGYDPLPFIGRCVGTEDPEEIVRDIRAELGLDIDWFRQCQNSADSFRFLRGIIESCGVLIMTNGVVGTDTHRVLNVDEFRAFTLINEYAPLIFINARDTSNGKLFSLLHELAHVWLGRNSLYNEPYGNFEGLRPVEQKCNAVAAEILVPDVLFREQWKLTGEKDLERLIKVLAGYFRCSRSVVARKALEGGFIAKRTFRDLTRRLQEEYLRWRMESGKRKTRGGNFYKTQAVRWSQRFISALAQSAKNGRTQYTEAYRLLGASGRTFDKLVQEVNGK